jgi:hypothetical protein
MVFQVFVPCNTYQTFINWFDQSVLNYTSILNYELKKTPKGTVMGSLISDRFPWEEKEYLILEKYRILASRSSSI